MPLDERQLARLSIEAWNDVDADAGASGFWELGDDVQTGALERALEAVIVREPLIVGRVEQDAARARMMEQMQRDVAQYYASRDAALDRARQSIGRHRATLVLGEPTGDLELINGEESFKPGRRNDPNTPSPEYLQTYQYGQIRVLGARLDPVTVEPYYTVDIVLSAIRCFGVDDTTTDEPYLVATLLNVAAPGTGDTVRFGETYSTSVQEGIRAGRTFAENHLMFRDVVVGRHGVWLKLSLFDHEHGSPEQVRREYQQWADAAAADREKAMELFEAGGAAEEAVDAIDSSSVGELLSSLVREAFVDLLDDDVIGEKSWLIPAQWIRELVDEGRYTTSGVVYDPRELADHVDTNFPYEGIYDGDKLFSNGDASYKVYLRVVPFRIAPDSGTVQRPDR